MGNFKTKHVDISSVPEKCSSEDFLSKRRKHYKNEFIDKKVLSEDETSAQGREREKKPTFLEPPLLHSEEAKEVFRQKSVRSEVDEFTYAKEVLEKRRRRNRSRIEEREFHVGEKGVKEGRKNRWKKKTEIRNRSHEPVSDANSNRDKRIAN